MDQTPDHIWLLIARKLSGEASAEELQQLEAMLRESPDAGYSKEILQDIWQNQLPTDSQYAEGCYQELVQQLKQMGVDEGRFTEDEHYINGESAEPVLFEPGKRKRYWLSAAALAVIVLVSGVIFWMRDDAAGKEMAQVQHRNQINTKNGSKTSLVLPDGTKVWLNSGSQLDYDKNYGSRLREVSLMGEAYFDVVKNPEKPFVIHTAKMDIRVLGTAFNVKCYPGEKTTETSLVRGSIEVTLKDRQEKIMLKPNEKLVISNTDENHLQSSSSKQAAAQKMTVSEKPIISLGHMTYLPDFDAVLETAWVQNRLVFSSETFEDVALKMERWYNVEIEFADEGLKKETLTGNFEKETLGEALEALKLATPFSYSIKNNRIAISRDNLPAKK